MTRESSTLRLTTDPFTDVFSLLGEGLGVRYAVLSDGGEKLLLVFAVEWWLSHQHLVQEDTVRPPIYALPVRQILDYLSN